MIHFIEHPISSLNRQLNKVLKNETDTVETKYAFPLLQTLVGHLNTLIHRAKNPIKQEQHLSLVDHNAEALELIQILPLPALVVDKSKNMIGGNIKFEEVIGLHGAQLTGQPLSSLSDQALVLSLNDLLDRSLSTTQGLVNKLEFASQTYDIHLKVFHGDNEVKYYVFVLISQNGGFHVS
jgi:transcriptional regulator with PAS, ATPase and Fis domain